MADILLTIIGSCGRDPELKFTNGGRAVASTGVAVSRRYQKDGEWVDSPTTWFNVVAWGQLGENFAQSASKGDRVIVTGRLEQRTYTDRDGNEKQIEELVADEIGTSLKWATVSVARTPRTQAADEPFPG